MGRFTILVIPENATTTKQFTVKYSIVKTMIICSVLLLSIMGYFTYDYWQLRFAKTKLTHLISENEGLKGEARLLMKNLEEVKRSLNRVQDYSSKLSRLTNFKVDQVSAKTGIGPLTPEEYQQVTKNNSSDSGNNSFFPLGINMEQLIFKPVFKHLDQIGQQANQNALELQQLLSSLSQKKSLLSSIPSISPVNGWITSNFGPRISPFTGKKTMHKGIDVASATGTPIYAPADGVIIYSGRKSGYGNYIMIAHGYGIVTGYGHNSQNMVHPGQKVKRGDQIATVGTTGRSTGPHLHYEIIVNGKHSDPKKFILHF